MRFLLSILLWLAATAAQAQFVPYVPSGTPSTLSKASSAAIREEFQSIAAGINSAYSAASTAGGASLTGTSASSVATGLGSKVFTTQAGKAWTGGTNLAIFSTASGDEMIGQVTAYTGTQLTVNVTYSTGSSTNTDWSIGLAAVQVAPATIPQGGTGATTAAGARASLAVPGLADNNTFTGTQIFSNTVTHQGLTKVTDTQFDILNASDPTRILMFDVSGVATGTTRTLKAPDASGTIALAGDVAVTVRQTVDSGTRDSSGLPNFVSAGAGLNYNIDGTTPVVMAFANGFGANGNADSVAVISASATNQATLFASNTNYNYAVYSSPTAVTWGATKAPWQVGDTYNQANASVLQFGGAAGSTTFLDDFGPTWAAHGGAKVQTNDVVFGTGALGGAGTSNALNGAGDFISSPSFATAPTGSWTARAWIKPTTLPSSGNNGLVFGYQASTAFGTAGFTAEIINTAGTSHMRYVFGSSVYNDIGNIAGTGVLLANARHFVEVSYNALTGVYQARFDGASDGTLSSATKIGTPTSPTMFVGGSPSGGNITTGGLIGYLDKFEFLPYCDHPVGTTATNPTGAPSISAAGYAQDWFDIGAMQMKSPSAASTVPGTNPTFSTSKKLYHSEQDTNGTTVTATRVYAYRRRYDQTFVVTATPTTKNHNLGVPPGRVQILENNVEKYLGPTLLPLTVTWTPSGTATARVTIESAW